MNNMLKAIHDALHVQIEERFNDARYIIKHDRLKTYIGPTKECAAKRDSKCGSVRIYFKSKKVVVKFPHKPVKKTPSDFTLWAYRRRGHMPSRCESYEFVYEDPTLVDKIINLVESELCDHQPDVDCDLPDVDCDLLDDAETVKRLLQELMDKVNNATR